MRDKAPALAYLNWQSQIRALSHDPLFAGYLQDDSGSRKLVKLKAHYRKTLSLTKDKVFTPLKYSAVIEAKTAAGG